MPLVFGNLASNVGDHRTEACELPGSLGETCQGLQVHLQIDRTPAR